MSFFKFKLVRDKIPEMLDEETRKKNPSFQKLSDLDARTQQELWLAKLQEELDELKEAFQSGDKNKIVEECADFQQAFFDMVNWSNVSHLEIGWAITLKNAERGSFSNGTVMRWLEEE